MHPEKRSKVEYTTADELVKDVQNLRWLGQGAQGVVYEGTWQGATVAVKFSVVENLDATAYELLFSRLLSHPNVVQTFVAKVAVLDEKTLRPRAQRCSGEGCAAVSVHRCDRCTTGTHSDGAAATAAATAAASALYRPAGAAATAAAAGTSAAAAAARAGSPLPAVVARCGGDCCGGGGGDVLLAEPVLPQQQRRRPPALARSDSFKSDDGFGSPFGRRSTFSDVREVLSSMGARPGHFITQMVMEHCDHGSLHSAIQRGIFKPNSRWGHKLALRALLRTVREVAQGMYHLHANNVLHGDLKPANVLLINSRKDRRGYVAKVSDFGMAQFCPQDHISNAPWGTLVYMAPERLLHGQLFPASDVFSFGVMLWEMYHGQRPYEGMHPAQIVMACAQGCARLEWAEDCLPEIVRISRACMATSPHDRPSFEGLMHELAALEARVRTDDAVRMSKSLDIACGGPSTDVQAASQLARAKTVSGIPKVRASLDVSFPAPTAAAAAGVAAAAAAAADRQSGRHRREGAAAPADGDATATAAAGTALPSGRHSADACCRTVSHSRCLAAPSGGAGAAAATVGPASLTPHGVLPLNCHARAYGSRTGKGGGAGLEFHGSAYLGRPDGDMCKWPGGCGGGGGACGLVVVGDSEPEGRRSFEDGSAAAIAAALAQQPGIASAVVTELLALLQQQQGQQQHQQHQQHHQQQPSQAPPPLQQSYGRQEAEGVMALWTVAAATTCNSSGTRACSSSADGGNGGMWRSSSGGLAASATEAAAAAAGPSALLPATHNYHSPRPKGCSPNWAFACGRSPSCSSNMQQQSSNDSAPPVSGGGLQLSLLGERRSSCGGAGPVLSVSAAAAALNNVGPVEASAGAAAGIVRSRTDGDLDSGASAAVAVAAAAVGEGGVDGGAWAAGCREASAALSSSCLSADLAVAAPEDTPFTMAVEFVREVDQQQQQQQQQQHSPAVACGAALTRRRSSHLPPSRRSSSLHRWECTTITEETL